MYVRECACVGVCVCRYVNRCVSGGVLPVGVGFDEVCWRVCLEDGAHACVCESVCARRSAWTRVLVCASVGVCARGCGALCFSVFLFCVSAFRARLVPLHLALLAGFL